MADATGRDGTMIQLDRIERRYGPRLLFEQLSWLIPPGARLGLVGPNGAGKTTLLRILCGRDQPDAGRVVAAPSLRVAYLPQEVESIGGGSVLGVVLAGFEELARLERRLEGLAERMASAADPREVARSTESYGEVRERFEALGGDAVEARARAMLSGLGVPERRFGEPVEQLSGGWRMRVVLARLLLAAPELLLLDEPTNHLDLGAIEWLEGFLESFEGAFVVVSHDRYFLNRMIRGVVELDRGRLTAYPGGYDDYLAAREAARAALEQAARQQARDLAKVERFIERFRYKNTKARQVQSRIRSLEKVERVRVERSSRRMRLGFPAAPRSGDVVVRAEDVSKRFGDRTVYDGMRLLLRRGDRVALVGPNGAGKSTLLKLLAGRLEVDGGTLGLGHNVVVRYYAQHQLEALDPGRTALEELETVAGGLEPARLRTLLGAFLFAGEDVQKPVAVLSGGEKARLALAKLLTSPCNLLLLDEPTNHLDLPSREALEDALEEYEGTLVVISHDRYFINRVATSVAEVARGRVELLEGDYDEYLAWRARRAAAPAPAAPPPEDDGGETGQARLRRERKRQEAEDRNRRYRQRREAEARRAPLESAIEDAERRLGELDELTASPQLYADAERARAVGRERREIEEAIGRLYAEWDELLRALEAEEEGA